MDHKDATRFDFARFDAATALRPEHVTDFQRLVKDLRVGSEFSADFLQNEHAGDYWVSVTARSKDGQPIGEAASRFLVDERDLELDNPAADHALLAELAALTGGSVVTPEQHGAFLERLQKEGLVRREETEVTRKPLWDNWPFLLVFVTLLATEWTIRKLRGLV